MKTTKHRAGKSASNKERYDYYAQAASQKERVGEYDDAAEKWDLAAIFADTPEKEEWAKRRCEFCERMATVSSDDSLN